MVIDFLLSPLAYLQVFRQSKEELGMSERKVVHMGLKHKMRLLNGISAWPQRGRFWLNPKSRGHNIYLLNLYLLLVALVPAVQEEASLKCSCLGSPNDFQCSPL